MNNSVALTLIVFRLIAACICAAGSVWLAHDGINGWGWLIFSALCFGCVTFKSDKDDKSTT